MMKNPLARKKSVTPSTPQAYLSALPADKRAALQKLRRAIKAAAPDLEECMAYGLPSFRLHGKYLLSYGAGADHCAFYPGSVVQKIPADLKNYATARGTVRFSPSDPLPDRIVRKLVRLRLAHRRS